MEYAAKLEPEVDPASRVVSREEWLEARKALLQQDLVQANRDGPDRRAVQLRVTPAGREVLKRVPGPFAGVLPDALARLDPQTLERLDRDLGALIDLLQADQSGAGIPLAHM